MSDEIRKWKREKIENFEVLGWGVRILGVHGDRGPE